MRTPIPRDPTSELLARFERVRDRALDSVPEPTLTGCYFGDLRAHYHDVENDADAPEWAKKDAAKFFLYHEHLGAATSAAVDAEFSRAELEILAYKDATTARDRQRLGMARDYAKRGLKRNAIQSRHSYLLRLKVDGSLPSRVCPCCAATLVEDSWDPKLDESGEYEFTQPVTCGLPQCESAFVRDVNGIGTLGVEWGWCCVWCQRWFRTDAADPGERPPDEGEDGHDPTKSAAWDHSFAEYNIFRSLCSPTCYSLGVGWNAFASEELGECWDVEDVPRTWTGGVWPTTVYLPCPPISVGERHQAGAGKWARPVTVAWDGSAPALVAGKPHPWMLEAPAWASALHEYANKLQAGRALRGIAVTPLALGEGQRALPPGTDDIIDVEALTSLDRYVTFLRERGAATDKQAHEATGLPLGTLKWLRHQHSGLFIKGAGRPAPWTLRE